MLKKLIAGIILVLFLVIPAFPCELPMGTKVIISTPQGIRFTSPMNDRTVEPIEVQPTINALTNVSKNVGEDWTDGVVVLDEAANAHVLVHKSDLIPCEDKQTKKE